jgi:hypothetical protein
MVRRHERQRIEDENWELGVRYINTPHLTPPVYIVDYSYVEVRATCTFNRYKVYR